MGTNYYAEMSIHGIPLSLHIGKSSMGWKFLFAKYDNLSSKKEWEAFLAKDGVSISDEYGDKFSRGELLREIEYKQSADRYDYLTAPLSVWPSNLEERSKHERLDEEGYRISFSPPEDWS